MKTLWVPTPPVRSTPAEAARTKQVTRAVKHTPSVTMKPSPFNGLKPLLFISVVKAPCLINTPGYNRPVRSTPEEAAESVVPGVHCFFGKDPADGTHQWPNRKNALSSDEIRGEICGLFGSAEHSRPCLLCGIHDSAAVPQKQSLISFVEGLELLAAQGLPAGALTSTAMSYETSVP